MRTREYGARFADAPCRKVEQFKKPVGRMPQQRLEQIAKHAMTDSVPSIKTRNPWSWYAVAPSQDLLAGKIMQAVLNGERLVLWRSQDGRASAWSDRCPHRGMRLSLGATRGEFLVCPYHGWTFGIEGNCRHIPAHPNLSPSRAARARIYPIAEENGYVWVCLGEPSSSRPPPVANFSPVRTIHVAIDIDMAIAVLLACPLEPTLSGTGTACRPIGEDVEWKNEHGAVVVSSVMDGDRERRFTARGELPGQVSCKLKPQGGGPLCYRALIQPTEFGACAIHLAVEAPASCELKLALNRSLVALRHDIEPLARVPAVTRALEAFVQIAPDHAHA